MNKHSRSRLILLLALDILMIALELYALTVSWMESGAKLFRYYTQDSNILALIVCISCASAELSSLRSGKKLPGWTRSLRHLAASCLLFTLVVAGFLLTPVEEHRSFFSFMLEGKYLFLHTLCPLICVLQLFLHPGKRFREKHALRALVPTLVYGAVSLMLNAAGAYSGPYPFLRIREQEGYVTAVGCLAVLCVAYASARILAALSFVGAAKKRPEHS